MGPGQLGPGPNCPGPNCPGPSCPGPDSPGPNLPRILTLSTSNPAGFEANALPTLICAPSHKIFSFICRSVEADNQSGSRGFHNNWLLASSRKSVLIPNSKKPLQASKISAALPPIPFLCAAEILAKEDKAILSWTCNDRGECLTISILSFSLFLES